MKKPKPVELSAELQLAWKIWRAAGVGKDLRITYYFGDNNIHSPTRAAWEKIVKSSREIIVAAEHGVAPARKGK